ncbi:MAG: ketoacyl-ACP synthase III [Bacteroidaceae bacterium]|nr:ketoacyl-ACP synthase III [Bacteroidaceae bacterium]MBR3374020.1 ketoacyl-ACP synthase III [Bacteroidaceae bacterium]MBR3733860.1 ketoacyl-ACP synthase III [Bacteroidaceae bacterium]MBR4648907.1 ketoacyl-ACP synthase III [Bacteroidaceae bacterium]MBR6714205.1 ketoacyl-ACP synthase III [Bacteroidaceae bacterium]
MGRINAVITGVGGWVPTYILDNEEMSTIVDTSDEWIMERIGVKTRHILKPEEGTGTSFMMTKAVKQLLDKTGVDPDSIDAVIAATCTFDYHFPSTASLIIGNLDLKNAFGFDLEAACAGFLYAMEQAASLICSGRHKRVIVCGGDHMSSMTNYQDRNTCPIFGDGAACVLMEATEEEVGLIDSYLRVDGKGYDNLHMAAGGSARMPSHETVDERLHFVYQEGRAVFKHAVTDMSDAVVTIAQRNGLNKDNVTWIVPHQANVRIESAVARRIGVSEDHVMINIDHMANTSSGTLPLCLWEYEPLLKKGDKIIFTAFGAGFTWGASYMIWGYDGSKFADTPAEFYKEGMISREEWYAKRRKAQQ